MERHGLAERALADNKQEQGKGKASDKARRRPAPHPRAVAETGSAPSRCSRAGDSLSAVLWPVSSLGPAWAPFSGSPPQPSARLPGQDDWQRAMWLAAGAWVVVRAVPATKYPPNPPGVGDPETITRRTLMWLTLVGVVPAVRVGERAAVAVVEGSGRLGTCSVHRQVVVYVALVVAATLALPPTGDSITPSANLVWHFRIASAGGQLILWSVLGMAFGVLAWREDHPRPATMTPSMATGA